MLRSLIFIKLFIYILCSELQSETTDLNNADIISSVSNENNLTINETNNLIPSNEIETNLTEINKLNETLEAKSNSSAQKVILCSIINETKPVEIVNATHLLKLLIPNPNITTKDTPADCVAVLFYGTACPFSAAAAPQFNALARVFANVRMVAIDAITYHIFNAQNGIVGVPTLMLFHNGRAVAKYNETEYRIEMLVKFIGKHVGMSDSDIESLHYVVTSDDFRGPLSNTPEYQRDYCLVLSWIFIIICSIYFFSKSKWCQNIIETIQNTWREAEAQHEHAD